MKKLILTLTLILVLAGCGNKKDEKVVSNLSKAKDNMLSSLQNFSYDVTMVSETGFMDVETKMNCKDDSKNKISYCITSTMGTSVEQYIDYDAKKVYTKTSSIFGGDTDWVVDDYSGTDSNSWLNLNDYIYDLTEESTGNGTNYTGKIDGKKLAQSMATVDSSMNSSSAVSSDIAIQIFVNSSNYVETMSFDMEIMGMKQYVDIEFNNFNTSGSLSIPSEIKG